MNNIIIQVLIFVVLGGVIGSVITIGSMYLWYAFVARMQDKKKFFKMGDYTFKLVETEQEDKDFNYLVNEMFRERVRVSEEEYRKIMDTVTLKIAETCTGTLCRFIAYYKDSVPVGSIFLALDDKNIIPLEEKQGIKYSLDEIRKHGNISEACRFCIIKTHRMKPVLFEGLLKCVVECALINNIHIMVTEVFKEVLPVYEKIGFKRFNIKPFYSAGYKQDLYPMYLNLASMIVYHKKMKNYVSGVKGNISKAKAVTYYWRTKISNFFRKHKIYDMNFSDSNIIKKD